MFHQDEGVTHQLLMRACRELSSRSHAKGIFKNLNVVIERDGHQTGRRG